MGVLVATYICITYHHINVVTLMLWHVGGRGEGTLDPQNLLFPWPGVTFGIFMARLTNAVNYKMALRGSFAGIRALSRFLTG